MTTHLRAGQVLIGVASVASGGRPTQLAPAASVMRLGNENRRVDTGRRIDLIGIIRGMDADRKTEHCFSSTESGKVNTRLMIYSYSGQDGFHGFVCRIDRSGRRLEREMLAVQAYVRLDGSRKF